MQANVTSRNGSVVTLFATLRRVV